MSCPIHFLPGHVQGLLHLPRGVTHEVRVGVLAQALFHQHLFFNQTIISMLVLHLIMYVNGNKQTYPADETFSTADDLEVGLPIGRTSR